MEPTVLHYDNQPAGRIAESRGSLQGRSRHMDIRTYYLRQQVEDDNIKLKWIETRKMIADLGTKLLDEKTFVFLRDLMNGYAIVKAAGHKGLPIGVFDVRFGTKSRM